LALRQNNVMTIFARVARFLFWLLVLSWSMWLLRRIVGGLLRKAELPAQHAAGPTAAQAAVAARRLVRDPVCGMHVDETLSIPLREEGELVHFCSTACRDAYESSTRKLAANG
jgi:YHS domain-containing protein